eukprot:4080423-Heterocapsa_arctica.AAC.1
MKDTHGSASSSGPEMRKASAGSKLQTPEGPVAASFEPNAARATLGPKPRTEVLMARLKEFAAVVYGATKKLFKRMVEAQAESEIEVKQRAGLENLAEELPAGDVPPAAFQLSTTADEPTLDEQRSHYETHLPRAA